MSDNPSSKPEAPSVEPVESDKDFHGGRFIFGRRFTDMASDHHDRLAHLEGIVSALVGKVDSISKELHEIARRGQTNWGWVIAGATLVASAGILYVNPVSERTRENHEFIKEISKTHLAAELRIQDKIDTVLGEIRMHHDGHPERIEDMLTAESQRLDQKIDKNQILIEGRLARKRDTIRDIEQQLRIVRDLATRHDERIQGLLKLMNANTSERFRMSNWMAAKSWIESEIKRLEELQSH